MSNQGEPETKIKLNKKILKIFMIKKDKKARKIILILV